MDTPETELTALAACLTHLGCPADKALEMAAQLDRRAGQLATQTGRDRNEALAHLLRLMQQGWNSRNPNPPAC